MPAIVACLALFLFAAPLLAQPAPAPSIPQTHRLKSGIFTYRDSDPGKRPGTSVITIRATPEGCEISAIITLSPDFKDFRSQQWKTVSGPHLEPRSASLNSGEGPSAVPLFDLQYTGGHVTGYLDRRHGAGKRPIDADLPEGIIDQRIDWARVLATKLTPGSRFQFQAYDPGLGVSQAVAEVNSTPMTLHLPAGDFEALEITYVIRKATGTEQYRVFTTRSEPRILLREDFGNGVSTELLRSAPLPEVH